LRVHLLIQFLFVFQQKTKDEITRLERDVDGRNYIDCYFETRKIIECRLREYLLWDREGAKKKQKKMIKGTPQTQKFFPSPILSVPCRRKRRPVRVDGGKWKVDETRQSFFIIFPL
jgi:hypothetical protein